MIYRTIYTSPRFFRFVPNHIWIQGVVLTHDMHDSIWSHRKIWIEIRLVEFILRSDRPRHVGPTLWTIFGPPPPPTNFVHDKISIYLLLYRDRLGYDTFWAERCG